MSSLSSTLLETQSAVCDRNRFESKGRLSSHLHPPPVGCRWWMDCEQVVAVGVVNRVGVRGKGSDGLRLRCFTDTGPAEISGVVVVFICSH